MARFGISFEDEPLRTVHSVSFYNSMCVIAKEAQARNLLGMRLVGGNSFEIEPSVAALHGTFLTSDDVTLQVPSEPRRH